MQLGQAEDPHDGVADEPLDRASVPFDHRAADIRVPVEQGVHRFGVEPLGQPRRPDHVGEDDAHQPARGRPLGDIRRPLGDIRRRLGHIRRRLDHLHGSWSGHLKRQGRILFEDCSLELAQALPGLDAELLDELAPGVLVDLQRVGLAVRAIQGKHQLRSEVLSVGVVVDQRLELPDHLRMAADRQLGLDQLLERRDT